MNKMRVFSKLSIVFAIFFLSFQSIASATARNGYYHKETGNSFVFYDAMASYGSPTIDGTLSSGEWDTSLARDIYKYDRDDNRIRIMFQYDTSNLYMLIDVDDDKLYDDSGSNAWDTNDDDGVQIYIDPNNSRDTYMQESDRVIAFTVNGNNYRFDKGDGAGSTQYYGDISLIQKAVKKDGTVNNSDDTDGGYLVEVAVPWDELGVTTLLSFISVNIFVLEDDDGGNINVVYDEDVWGQPFEVDRYFKWFENGLNGPKDYARVYLLPQGDTTLPEQIDDLSTVNVQPYSCVISFTSPGDDGVDGEAVKYLIRYSTSGPITSESDWNNATSYENSFMPRIGGKAEELRVLGLNSSTTYYMAIRAEDYAGNKGTISDSLSFATDAAPTGYGNGHIYPSPVGRYFVYENGDVFLPVPEPIGTTWLNIRDLYTRELWNNTFNELIDWSAPDSTELGNADNYMKELSEKGINLVRIFIEDLAFADSSKNPHIPDGVAYLEYPATTNGSSYIEETLTFLDTLLETCAQYGIYVTMTPFDNYFYKDYWDANPYNTANGGMLSSYEDFVTSTTARTAQKKRLQTLYDVVKDHYNFFGWEMMNEWDNTSFASRNDGWEETRIEWMQELLTYLRSIDDEHMISISSVIWQPQFKLKDFLLLGDYFDFVCIHNYTKAVGDPVGAGDSDPTIRPTLDTRKIVSYMVGNTVDYRPLLDFESNPIDIEGYSSSYTQQDDEETFHNVMWAGFASGLGGMQVRWPGNVLRSNGPLLTETMWEYQTNMSDFFDGTQIDFKSFAGNPWERNISLSGTGSDNLEIFSTSDGDQGLIYVLHDIRTSSGTVSGVTLTVDGLQSSGVYNVETWDTRSTNGQFTQTSATASGGSFSITLPSFSKDTMLSFAYSAGSAIDPAPDILANDSGETLNINEGVQLSIAISFDPGSYTGVPADWYIVVNTPSGWQSFNVTQMDYSTSGLSALVQDFGLISFGSAGIFSTSSLSAGTYTYFFAVILSGQLYYDSVTVNVQ